MALYEFHWLKELSKLFIFSRKEHKGRKEIWVSEKFFVQWGIKTHRLHPKTLIYKI
jgi:hypothetical protein